MNQFYITLPSNTISTEDNSTAEYRVELAHSIQLSGDWEVGLAAIHYPYTWLNFPNEKFLFYIRNSKIYEVTLAPGNYETIEQLSNSLTHSYVNALTEIASIISIDLKLTPDQVLQKYRSAVRFGYSEAEQRAEIEISEVMSIRLSKSLQYCLGIHAKKPNFYKGKYVGKYPPDLTSGFTSLYVYTDIILPQLVGNIESQLLRAVSIKGTFGKTVAQDYSTIHYVPVLKKSLDSIKISIRDDNNTPVRFLYGKTIIKLHFRKKRYY